MDDYAHHPTEIAALAAAARARFPGRRIVAMFQPHTYARTRYLLDGFKRCFAGFDRLFILETYAAREAIADGMTGGQLAAELHDPAPTYAATFEGGRRRRRRGPAARRRLLHGRRRRRRCRGADGAGAPEGQGRGVITEVLLKRLEAIAPTRRE